MNKAIGLFLLASLSVVLVACGQYKVHTNYEGALLVDVRTPQEYAEGSVVGAINIPLHELTSRLTEIAQDQKVVVFCRSGNRSAQAKALLESRGYRGIIDGGTWQAVSLKLQATKVAGK